MLRIFLLSIPVLLMISQSNCFNQSNLDLVLSIRNNIAYRHYDEAIISLDTFIKSYPDDSSIPHIWMDKGAILIQLKRFDEAIICFDNSIKLKSNNAETWSLKSDAFDSLEKYNVSIRCLDIAIDIDKEVLFYIIKKVQF